MYKLTVTLIFSALISVASIAKADVANVYEADKLSSEAITAGVLSCVEEAEKSFKRSNVEPNKLVIIKYCSCSVDAYRSKRRTPVVKELKVCANWAENNHGKKPLNSPFLKKENTWNSEKIAGGQLGCEKGLSRTTIPYKQAFCGCFVDAVRSKGTSNVKKAVGLVTKQEEKMCTLIAEQRQQKDN